jgi:diphosphomevalonate decarboxylase
VDKHITSVESALRNKDLSKLAEVVMKDSNSMHATMLDTTPPIMYMDDHSKSIVYAIEDLNKSEGKAIAGYTFDAGANAHIITVEGNVVKVVNQIKVIEGIEAIVVASVGNGPELLGDGESLIDVKKLAPK